ncbi:MAG: DUF748 domain-containing protein [Gemmataceae bacterium]
MSQDTPNTAGTLKTEEAPKKATGSRFRWVGRSIILLVLLGGLVWVAPYVVAGTALRESVARWIFSDVRGNIHIGHASLSWFSPMVLEDVQLLDADGKVLLFVQSVRSEYDLFRLALNWTDLGPLSTDKATLHVRASKETTNFETVLHEYLNPDPESNGNIIAFELKVTEGTVHLEDQTTGRKDTFEDVALYVRVPPDDTMPLEVKCESTTTKKATPLKAEFRWAGWYGKTKAQTREISVTLAATSLPLETLQPWVRRFDSQARLAGRLTANLNGTWRQDWRQPWKGLGKGNVAVDDLELQTTDLGEDRLRLKSVVIPCRIEFEGDHVILREFRCECDVGNVDCRGAFELSDPVESVLSNNGTKLSGEIDLAQLARRLPNTLQIRKSMNITSGKAKLAIQSRSSPNRTVWEGRFMTQHLAGVADGRRLEWSRPITVSFLGRKHPGRWLTVEQLQCQSDFLKINANGDGDSWKGRATFDLAELSKQLGLFVAIDEQDLTGNGAADIVFRQQKDGRYQLDGTTLINNLVLGASTKTPVREKMVILSWKLVGNQNDKEVLAEKGSINFASGVDRLNCDLTTPLRWVGQSEGSVSTEGVLRLEGDLRTWGNRLRALHFLPEAARLQGRVEMATRFQLTPNAWQVKNAKLTSSNLTAQLLGFNIQEPKLVATASGTFHPGKGLISIPQGKVVAQAVELNLLKVKAEPTPHGTYRLTGGGKFRGDLEQLSRWLWSDTLVGNGPFGGEVVGAIALSTLDDRIQARLDVNSKELRVGPAKHPYLRNHPVQLLAKGDYDTTKDVFSFTDVEVTSPGLTLKGQGSIAKFSSAVPVVFLKGQMGYDLSKWETSLRNVIGGNLTIHGTGQESFELVTVTPKANRTGNESSPTFLTSLKGRTRFGWTSLQAHGVNIGPVNAPIRFEQGWIKLGQINTTLNKGKLQGISYLRTNPLPMGLLLAPENTPDGGPKKVIDRAEVTPKRCEGA